MKTNNNNNETRNALVINAIKAGSHEENALCVASGMVNEYPEFCKALWQLQRDGVIYYNNGGYYLTDETESNETADRMEADHAARVEVAADYLSKGATVEDWTRQGRCVVALDELHRVNISAAELDEAKAKATAPAEVMEKESEVITTYRHTTAARVAEVCNAIAEAVGVTFGSYYPARDMKIDLARFTKWTNGQSYSHYDTAAPFWFAVRKQGSESGARAYCRERCAALGAPVYVIKVEREPLAGLFTLKVRVSSPATREQVTRTAELAKTVGNEAAPRLAQFETLKEKHPAAVLIFRENRAASYILYNEDADTAADVLGLTVSTANGFRFVNFPAADLDAYLPKLVRSGHRCAICDQLEDPNHARQLSKRETWKIIEDRHHAPDFLTAQKFANMAAEDLAAQWDTDENAAAYALTETTTEEPRHIFAVTTGRAETLRSHARRAADRIADALNIEAGAAADLLAEVLTYWRDNMITRPAEDDTHPEATETATEPAEGSQATDTTPATSEADSDREKLRRELGPLAAPLRWLDRHPRTAAALLWLQAAALIWAVITYDFTTRI